MSDIWAEMIIHAGRIAGRSEDAASGSDVQRDASEGFLVAQSAMDYAETMAAWWARQAAALAALVVGLGIASRQPPNQLVLILDSYQYATMNEATRTKLDQLRSKIIRGVEPDPLYGGSGIVRWKKEAEDDEE